jgi:hypothetical protein
MFTAFGSTVLAGAALAEPQLTVVGGRGERGQVVQVGMELSGDAATAAVSADFDIAFPLESVAFLLPVREHCTIAPRLEATHQIGGMMPEPGVLSLAIFARGLAIHPLADGQLATCSVEILPEATVSPAALRVDFAALGDTAGRLLPVTASGGAIVIADLPGRCIADCNADAEVTVNEVIRAVGIALGTQPLGGCAMADGDGSGEVTINEVIEAVQDAISGC